MRQLGDARDADAGVCGACRRRREEVLAGRNQQRRPFAGERVGERVAPGIRLVRGDGDTLSRLRRAP
jgi:hypothetical protein